MRSIRTPALAGVVVAAVLMASPALGFERDVECIRDARDDFKVCKIICKEAYLTEKDLCRNIDPDCGDLCRAARSLCMDPVLAGLEACKTPCNDALQAAKDQCRIDHEAGTPERDACIDAAQLIAFACRDTCREGVRDELRICRKANRLCIRACPPPPEG
jgi:hypothetical protein